MEALLAVGLAGNVVQFVTCTGKFISEANEIRKSGSHTALPGLKKLAEVLTSQSKVLRSRLKAFSATLAEEDQVNHANRHVYS